MTHEEEIVARARMGDRAALDQLVGAIKELVYNLAIRMLGDPADAEDASQEILIRVVTGLASFRGESAFRTWVYRVAANHLLTARKRHAEERTESFEAMASHLEAGLAWGEPPAEDPLLVGEAKLFCTSGMLLCLDRDHRLAFILGGILELSSEEAAAVLEITPEALRKRLSRARARMSEFMRHTCGLVDDRLRCRCGKQAASAVRRGLLDPQRLRWATHPVQRLRAVEQPRVDELDEMERAVAIFRSHPDYAAPASLVDGLKQLIESGKSGLLD